MNTGPTSGQWSSLAVPFEPPQYLILRILSAISKMLCAREQFSRFHERTALFLTACITNPYISQSFKLHHEFCVELNAATVRFASSPYDRVLLLSPISRMIRLSMKNYISY